MSIEAKIEQFLIDDEESVISAIAKQKNTSDSTNSHLFKPIYTQKERYLMYIMRFKYNFSVTNIIKYFEEKKGKIPCRQTVYNITNDLYLYFINEKKKYPNLFTTGQYPFLLKSPTKTTKKQSKSTKKNTTHSQPKTVSTDKVENGVKTVLDGDPEEKEKSEQNFAHDKKNSKTKDSIPKDDQKKNTNDKNNQSQKKEEEKGMTIAGLLQKQKSGEKLTIEECRFISKSFDKKFERMKNESS